MVSSKQLSGVSTLQSPDIGPRGPATDWICNNEAANLFIVCPASALASLVQSVVFNKTNGEFIGHNDIASRQPTQQRQTPILIHFPNWAFVWGQSVFIAWVHFDVLSGRKFYLKCASLSPATFGRNQSPADSVLPYKANEYLRRTIM